MRPLAYLLTFTTYGTHLPGSQKGWIDSRYHTHGSPLRTGTPAVETYWRRCLKEQPWVLCSDAQAVVLQAILSVCKHREWSAQAIHVRSTHVHAVVCGKTKPERMVSDFKAYATRALRSFGVAPRSRYWTHHGSTRYLWNEASLRAAIEYVLNGQGAMMTYYAIGF